jgi:hypothetical protein
MSKAKKQPAKPAKTAQPKISIKGPFVFATFLRVCRSMEMTHDDALALFVTLQKQGEILDAGGVGFSGQIKSFTFKQ